MKSALRSLPLFAAALFATTTAAATAAVPAPTAGSPAQPAAATARSNASNASNASDTFDVFEYAVEGNSVLPVIDIERAVYPWLGPGKRVADVEGARAALEAAYQNAGYLSVSVALPEQSVAGGVIRLQVVEGQVERLKVSGNRYTARSELRGDLPEVAAGKVPHFPTMQSELAQAATPDRRVTPLLRPGSRPGTMEVEVAVEDELPLHGNVELNNRQSPDTSTLRLEAGIRYDNLFQKRHSAGLNYVVAPQHPEEVRVFSGFYSVPLSATRSFSGFVQYSDSDIASAIGSNVVGKGTTLGARFSQTLPAPPGIANYFHSLSLGADYKNLKQTQSTDALERQTPLRYLPLVAQYTFSHFGESGEYSGNLGLTANLGTNSRDIYCKDQDAVIDQFACSRTNARPGFGVTRGELAYSKRQLGWEGVARFNFQLSADALVSSEQFLAGGMDSVRGYYEGEAAGDAGWRLGAEIRTPSFIDDMGYSLRAAGFVEGARLWRNDALAGETDHYLLASAGVGLRLKGDKDGLIAVADLARTLKDGPNTARDKLRVSFRLGYGF